MAHHKDDKYADEPTQVRSIIKQLNNDKPSKVKSKEVVIRADGTKVVRVTKKRRVMLSESDKKRKGRKQFLLVLLAIFLLSVVGLGVFFVRMASMTGESYVNKQAAELKEIWGASDMRVVGSGVSGSGFHLDSLVVTFPESSMVERVEINGIEAELDSSTFFSGHLTGDLIRAKRIFIRLREGAKNLSFPLRHGDDLWFFRRVECADFNLCFGEGENSPVSIEHSYAYMYYPDNAYRDECVFCLKDGVVKMTGWKKIHITNGKFNVSKVAIEDFALEGTTDAVGAGNTMESAVTRLAIYGSILDQAPLAGPYTFDSDNMPLTEFTDGRFQFFMAAKTRSVPQAKEKSKALVTLPFNHNKPQFRGDFPVKQLSIMEIPAVFKLIEHIEPIRRKTYTPPTVHEALIQLDHVDDSIIARIEDGQAVERDTIEIRCDLSVDDVNRLKGTMSFGLPAVLTHAEYPDGMADPILQETDGMAWLTAQVSGPANHPQDDSDILEARAAEARKSRPERIPFERIDVDRLAERMRQATEEQDARPQLQNNKDFDLDKRNRDNPFESEAEKKQKSPTIDDSASDIFNNEVSPF